MAKNKYIPVIGFEVHLQPKTKSKMFCSCDAKYFGSEPNKHTCPVCMGLPGALPVPNQLAIQKCLQLALAMNCSINYDTKFDRKNYFYPDLPKGYQISQYDKPIGYDGFIEFDIEGDSRRIRIKRVHMEEDTAKSVHEGEKTLVDFNKSGVPLIEIVTEPDFQTVEEVDKFAKRLRQIVRYLDISDADMEKGQMRYELNMSLRKISGKDSEGSEDISSDSGTSQKSKVKSRNFRLPDYKVEVKNIASISVLKKIIEKEILRQSELLDQDQRPRQETRGLRGMNGDTVSQRTKEEAEDYRYFPEPDIPLIKFDESEVESVKAEMIELPQAKKHRYMEELQLEPDSAETLVASKVKAAYFEKCVDLLKGKLNLSELAKEVSKWIIGELAMQMKNGKVKFKDLKVTPEYLVSIVEEMKKGTVNGSIAKKVLEEVFKTGKKPMDVIKENGYDAKVDSALLDQIVVKVIEANEKVVADISKNPNAIKFLLGQVMRETKGQANAVDIENAIKGKLGI